MGSAGVLAVFVVGAEIDAGGRSCSGSGAVGGEVGRRAGWIDSEVLGREVSGLWDPTFVFVGRRGR